MGIKITKLQDGRITLTQPQLINSIITDLNFAPNTKPKDIRANSSVFLQRDVEGDEFDKPWTTYRSVIGKLNFLEKSTTPDTSYAVHQCARFASHPTKKSHGDAVRNFVRYLYGTRDKGIIMNPHGHDFTVAVDNVFSGNWNKDTAMNDVMTVKSMSGYIIMYSGCPILWSSKLQTEIALSTTETEYVACSNSLRETIPIMNLMDEMRRRYENGIIAIPIVKCELFEDNSGALEIATVHKMRPRTKHINIKYHHFQEYVRLKKITIQSIKSEDNYSDGFTKPLPVESFRDPRNTVQGW